MPTKRSTGNAAVFFVGALMALYQLVRLGGFYGYGVPLFSSVALRLASGHLAFYAARKVWRLPKPQTIPLGVALAVVFFAVVPQILFYWWPHTGRGYSLGFFMIIFLELSFRALRPPTPTAGPL
jgi:hypothetical protein